MEHVSGFSSIKKSRLLIMLLLLSNICFGGKQTITNRGKSKIPIKKNTPDIESTQRMLLGKWVSVKDHNDILIVTDKYWITPYTGTENDSSVYNISDKSCSEGTKTEEGMLYLSIGDENDMCYEIEGLNNKSLSLMYLLNGNTLLYKRITK